MAIRAANRMRVALRNGVASMPYNLQALFAGLVIGDDRDQPREMVNQFRASGLSHLCAVSGQNVAYLLAALSPFLNRMRRTGRFIAILIFLVWFVLLTRAEPSVLRAAVMAGLVALNAASGTSMNARTILASTVIVLLLIDPMLAWSVGFALSVGATAGLAWLSARLGHVLSNRGMLAATLAAQVGTMPVSLFVFGYVPVISLVANPLALWVAGMVMMVGLQGSGKTTTAAKLARKLKGEGRQVRLIAGDVYRPAAIDQLITLGKQIDVPVFEMGTDADPVEIARLGVEKAIAYKGAIDTYWREPDELLSFVGG
jgi:competence protein ComEC